MSDERDDAFDFHIEVEAHTEQFSNERIATCTVTFPNVGTQPPIIKTYYGPWESEAIAPAIEDISAFLFNPNDWVKAFVEASTEAGRKLAYAHEQVAFCANRAASYQRSADEYRKDAERYAQEIARLKATTQEKEQ